MAEPPAAKRVKLSPDKDEGLGDHTLLAKIDKLRALNIGTEVPLPQLIVVGDQSSGKSSVLESLTGFSFPRGAGLCTRYATQITCRREDDDYTDISIIPRSSANEAVTTRLRAFKRRVTGSQARESIAEVFQEANREMGLRDIESDGNAKSTLPTFSKHILKIEICGPNESHLTVIDVPGIIRNETPGLTTEADIKLIENMVKKYMKDSRTIILAVIPCNTDIATQGVLKLAKTADPDGIRTMGVLTKPDLAIGRIAKQAVTDLVLGKRHDLTLGYCVVKNRDADDDQSTLKQSQEREKTFFLDDSWSPIAETGRTGIGALRQRLRDILSNITKLEFPTVKFEIAKLHDTYLKQLNKLGPPRSDSHTQRAYLCKLSSEFQRIVGCALDATYARDDIFQDNPKLRLITRIIEENEAFAAFFGERGHTWNFAQDTADKDDEPELLLMEKSDDSADEEQAAHVEADDIPDKEDADEEEEEYQPTTCVDLASILPEYQWPDDPGAQPSNILARIRRVYRENRGPELGTFGGSVLNTVFKEQSKKWRDIVYGHLDDTIQLIHGFIEKILASVITEESVHKALWENVLAEKIFAAYKRAVDHADFLFDIELNTTPYTYNYYFASNLNKLREQRYRKAFQALAKNHRSTVTFEDFQTANATKNNAEQVIEEIHDILYSYYKVSRKRFVDAICQQVIGHCLVSGGRYGVGRDKSPLMIFDPALVMSLTDEELESIAGEDQGTRQRRDALNAKISKLEGALRELRR